MLRNMFTCPKYIWEISEKVKSEDSCRVSLQLCYNSYILSFFNLEKFSIFIQEVSYTSKG